MRPLLPAMSLGTRAPLNHTHSMNMQSVRLECPLSLRWKRGILFGFWRRMGGKTCLSIKLENWDNSGQRDLPLGLLGCLLVLLA